MRIAPTIFVSMMLFAASLVRGPAQVWIQSAAPSNNWTSVACSADGSQLAAVNANGSIYTSTNYGSTWVSNNAPIEVWTSVASSADGTRLVAAGSDAVFTNAGTTWSQAFSQSPEGFTLVTSSSDGTRLATASGIVSGHGGPGLFVSTNSGLTWSNADNSAYSQPWVALASSADGNTLVGAVQSEFTALTNGDIYTSTNAGASWTTDNVPAQVYYTFLAASADGSELLAANSGGLLQSTNSGSDWTVLTNAPAMNIVVCSTNGSVLFGTGSGQIYSSPDDGTTWATNTVATTNWAAIAVSGDGGRAVAAAVDGGIYILQPPPPLTLNLSAGGLVLAWPTNDGQFELQESPDLSTNGWYTTTNTPGMTNSSYQIDIPISNPQSFFRLKAL